MQDRSAMIWGLALLLGIPILFIIVAVWWLESRFSPDVALMVVAGTIGVICFSLGALFARGLAISAIRTMVDAMHDITQVEKQRQQTSRVYAQMERDAAKAALTAQTVDLKRVDKLAQERAKALTVQDRQADTWASFFEEEPQAAQNGGGNFF